MNEMKTLLTLIDVLLHNRVSISLRLLQNGRIEIWFGDDNGVRGCGVFEATRLDVATRWLLERAEGRYPDSQFARVRRLLRGYTRQCLIPDGKSHGRA